MAFNLADVLKDVSNSGTTRKQIEYIRLDLIDEDEDNFYALSEIEKLANNIATIGLQQPLVLRPSSKIPGRYIAVSGHRRRAALKMLAQEDPERWSEVECIVDLEAVSPYLQELKLIFGNSDTRRMSNADLDKQAQRVEELLYKLKEEGYEFPGRMRDHVAEAVGASKSKLARLKVIRENLAACWADAWKDGTIGESVAYNLSQMPKSWQTVVHNVWGEKANRLYADTVANAKRGFQTVTKIQCKHGLNLCEHTVAMMEKNCKEMYCLPCTGCCFDCSSLRTCKNVCPQALSKQKEMKAVAKKAQFDAQREQDERARPGAEFARQVWNRIGKARERSGCSIKDIVFARGESFYNETYDDPNQKKMESGEGNYSPNSTISFCRNLRACDVMNIVAVADALKCSVDYLLGRTERMELVSELDTKPEAKEVVSYSDTIWHTDDPDEVGDYLLIIKDPYCTNLKYEQWQWGGAGWYNDIGSFYPDIDGEIQGWVQLPKAPGAKSAPASNESCITGMSPSGHCGAAAYCSNEYACCLQCPDTSCNGRCGWPNVEAEG